MISAKRTSSSQIALQSMWSVTRVMTVINFVRKSGVSEPNQQSHHGGAIDVASAQSQSIVNATSSNGSSDESNTFVASR